MWQHESECDRTPSGQKQIRQELERQVKEFLAKGGQIIPVPTALTKAPNAYRVSFRSNRHE